MTVQLHGLAEARAQEASDLPAFGGINLLHVKRELNELLNQIGGNGIFDTYTVHDLRHIDAMLEMLDWLIPEPTQTHMSTADWLMTVLAIYFHDLGLLVTKNEYRSRSSSDFAAFRDKVLFTDDDAGKDYRVRISNLSPEDAERLLYQEYVRTNHAKRIRMWIQGKESIALGVSQPIAEEVDSLLRPLGPTFRGDLALICESHHLDDLDNLEKYRVSRPYGNSPAQTANLQYAAVLLRTADLLHITMDRAPSIAFRILNPADPVSQREWAKQMAVRAVRPQPGKNRQGQVDVTAARDTIEVHATFAHAEGFFGLTSYLSYAEKQVQQSHEFVLHAAKHQGAKHQFPWRYIDDSFIETEGFLKKQFEFTIDQAKILDLLTGHTLYNDTSVVIRELVQNSLDAIRLQFSRAKGAPGTHHDEGEVRVVWDRRSRTLEVKDNGTGMTQDIIENNLLKVGASRYQGTKFRDTYPEFSPISRFGIGVLSTFMIADMVEIITCHPDEEKGRYLSLRSVHGKYLIRLLDKESDSDARGLGSHGTLVRLTIRPSAGVGDFVQLLRRWVVIPGCRVVASVDGDIEVVIGYKSVDEALTALLIRDGFLLRDKSSRDPERPIKVEVTQEGGVALAYAVEWSNYFNEWGFVRAIGPRSVSGRSREAAEELTSGLGVLIEGIRVEFTSPGFRTGGIYAIANATGPSAPRTNVARSGLEVTPEQDRLLHSVYAAYCRHVGDEVEKLHRDRSRSLTWAAGEASYLLRPLVDSGRVGTVRVRPVSATIFEEELGQLPAYVVEERGERQILPVAELQNRQVIWTVESPFLRHAEDLIREFPGNTSLRGILQTLGSDDFNLPDETLLCSGREMPPFDGFFSRKWEVGELRASREARRLDVMWLHAGAQARWINPISPSGEAPDWYVDLLETTEIIRARQLQAVLFPSRQVPVSGFEDEQGVRVGRDIYMLPSGSWSKLMDDPSLTPGEIPDTLTVFAVLASLVLSPSRSYGDVSRLFAERIEPSLKRYGWWARVDKERLFEAIRASKWKIYDTWFWQRGGQDPFTL